jgi:transglutaminase-like putative cysteine protease
VRSSIFLICALLLATSSVADAVESRTFHFKYSATIPSVEHEKQVELWLPLLLESRDQEIEGLHIHAPVKYVIETEAKHGNRMLKVSGTGADLSGKTVQFHFQATRHAIAGEYEHNDGNDVYLAGNALVPIDGIIAERAAKSAGGVEDPWKVARALYDDVVVNLAYDKSGDGWGKGDALYACTVEKGNCTDYHSLFIGMCRSMGIPARFTIGFPLPAEEPEATIGGYHCWAEFWIDGKGWIPVDASEASKHPDQKDMLFAGLDPNRIEFTRGRDLALPGHPNLEPMNYFIYPFLLVDGKPTDGVERNFHFQETEGS